MKFILYGPPGIGKTTIIRQLKDAGYPALDLEDLPDTQSRELVLDAVDNCFVGGADTKPTSKYDRVNLLLGLGEEEYAERRRQRDLQHPEKSEQDIQTTDQWSRFSDVWNNYIIADSTALDTLMYIIQHPHVRIKPKPHKDADNWTKVVSDHHDSVAGIMSWFSFQIAEAARKHDMDKLFKDNPNHGENAHHWYRPDHSNKDDVTLLALLESIADTVATTWGRYLNDPWERELWAPPLQTSEWSHDTYHRTLRDAWNATAAYQPVESFPGFKLFDAPTNTKGDD